MTEGIEHRVEAIERRLLGRAGFSVALTSRSGWEPDPGPGAGTLRGAVAEVEATGAAAIDDARCASPRGRFVGDAGDDR